MAKKQTTKTVEEKNTKPEPVQDTKPVKPVKAVKPAKKESTLSNLALGRKLLAEKADEKKIIAAFTESYKRKGQTDADYIAKRAAIYMRIAAKATES